MTPGRWAAVAVLMCAGLLALLLLRPHGEPIPRPDPVAGPPAPVAPPRIPVAAPAPEAALVEALDLEAQPRPTPGATTAYDQAARELARRTLEDARQTPRDRNIAANILIAAGDIGQPRWRPILLAQIRDPGEHPLHREYAIQFLGEYAIAARDRQVMADLTTLVRDAAGMQPTASATAILALQRIIASGRIPPDGMTADIARFVSDGPVLEAALAPQAHRATALAAMEYFDRRRMPEAATAIANRWKGDGDAIVQRAIAHYGPQTP